MISCAVNPATAKANEIFAIMIVKLKGGQILSGTARFVARRANGISSYVIEAFTDCGESALHGGDHRQAAGLTTGDGKDGHHLAAKGHRLHKSRPRHPRRLLHRHQFVPQRGRLGTQRTPRGGAAYDTEPERQSNEAIEKAAEMGCQAVADTLKDIARKKGRP